MVFQLGIQCPDSSTLRVGNQSKRYTDGEMVRPSHNVGHEAACSACDTFREIHLQVLFEDAWEHELLYEPSGEQLRQHSQSKFPKQYMHHRIVFAAVLKMGEYFKNTVPLKSIEPNEEAMARHEL